MHRSGKLWIVALSLMLAACGTTLQSTLNTTELDPDASWALMPITNVTDTAQAGLAAEDMVEHALRLRGIANLQHYPSGLTRDTLFEPTERKVQDDAQKWAHAQNVRYGVTGSVQEWHYKVGVDGEPAVGLTLQVIDLRSNQVVWSASGAQSGWSRSALSTIANALISDLADTLPLKQAAESKTAG